MPRGSVELPGRAAVLAECVVSDGEAVEEEGVFEITVYSSCCNTDKGIYYYTTYENRQITGVDMHREDLEGMEVVAYELVKRGGFEILN